jgi:hypothetical protein
MAGQVAAADRPRAAARPQPQTTGEPQGGPFIRHAPKGRRPVYNFAAQFGVYFGPAVVAAPGWYSGFRLRPVSTTGGGSGGVIAATAGGQDAPFSLAGLVQVKDAWGTNLMSGPGYDMLYLVQLLSGAYGWGPTRDLRNLPSWTGITAASGAFAFDTLLPFEFAQAYGVIAAANAALLPQVQISTNTLATMFSTSPSPAPTLAYELDADFYWLPDAPTEPPGIGLPYLPMDLSTLQPARAHSGIAAGTAAQARRLPVDPRPRLAGLHRRPGRRLPGVLRGWQAGRVRGRGGADQL